MSQQVLAQLKTVLLAEADAIKARDFAAIEGFSQKKAELQEQLSDATDTSLLREVHRLAEANARGLSILVSATRSLKARLERMGAADTAVGYNETGETMSCDPSSPHRRV